MRDLKSHKQKKCKTNRRKQEKQARDWKKLFHRTLRVCIASGSGFLLASGALLTAQMLLESGCFGVKQVRDEHQVRVSKGDILDASDIEIGDSLFDLELHMIGRKIEEHAWIAKAEVERSFPDQVVIRVAERDSRGLFNLEDVSEIHFDEQEGLVMHTRIGGVPVRMGKQGFAAKLNRLELIYDDLEPRLMALKYIDLNVTDRVIVKLDVKRTAGRS